MAFIVVDCEAPIGIGAPSVGDMTEFGAVDVGALQNGLVESFHGTTARKRRSGGSVNGWSPGSLWFLSPTTRPTTFSGSSFTSGAISGRIRSATPAAESATSTPA